MEASYLIDCGKLICVILYRTYSFCFGQCEHFFKIENLVYDAEVLRIQQQLLLALMPNVIFIFYSIIGERNKNLFVIQSCVYLSKCQNETKSKIKQNRSRKI